MIKINLLPVRQIKQRIKAKKEIFTFVAGVVALLLILFFVGYGQSSKISTLKAKTVALQKEKKKYQSIIKQIEKIKKDKLVLETKLKAIENLQANSQVPVRLLDEIARLTPSTRMWLQSLNLNNKSINLSGVAMDNATIAQYMEQISRSPYFRSAELKSSSLKKVGGQKLKSFSMTIGVNKPITAKVAAKK